MENLSLSETIRRLDDESPDYIGISCLAVEYSRHAHALTREIKKHFPDIATILGGVYCTLMPEFAMEDQFLDYCVLGEGEIVLKSLLKELENSRFPENLDGLAYRKEGKVFIRPQKTFITDLDVLPLPDYNKVDFLKYCWIKEPFNVTEVRDALPVARVYTSRGCPAGCNFCAVEAIAGKDFRSRSVKNVLDEIEFLIERYGIKEIIFYDDNLLFNKKRAKALFGGIIDRQFNIKFKSPNVAAYNLDNETLDLMRQAGCTALIIAVESANNRVLQKIIGKPLKIERIKPIVDYAKTLGFRLGALFVIGNPSETWEEIRNTLLFAEELEVYCHFSIATPLPKTRLYQSAYEDKLLTSDFNFYSGSGCSRGWMVTDQFTPFDLETLRVYEWDRINFGTPERRMRTARFFKVPESEVIQFSRNARVALQERYVKEEEKRLSTFPA